MCMFVHMNISLAISCLFLQFTLKWELCVILYWMHLSDGTDKLSLTTVFLIKKREMSAGGRIHYCLN